ncbi:erythromycin esterase family protein [Rhodococcus sp. P1Y]|uniref:erythromycin esterase family protein n=1 Tax=Rhodococcus sp. P1Y TaxID=1302308 RepID=UPI000EB416BF|nr:erythromycin esterase family protein [Rhodococcus sp. P1Y]AYJ50663.1 erythromycin esterase family protein [Rhodococcus sp. P1Y]
MPASPIESIRSIDAQALMELFSTRPRLFAIGEPTHGAEALLQLRNEVFRQLVEGHDYRIIALESDCVLGVTVDDYVCSGIGSLDEVMENGFSHEWGLLAGNRALVQWMREYNDGREASMRVRFAGFDGPLEMSAAASPRVSLCALHSYLAEWVNADLLPVTAETLDGLIGDDRQWTDPEAMMDPSKSIGRSAHAIDLRVLADDLVDLLFSQAPDLRRKTTGPAWDRACLHGRTATGLLRYHYWMADDSAARMARLCGLRDSMMAANLLALTEKAPTLVYAHNSHLQRQRSRMQMWQGPIEWWCAGAVVSAELNDDYGFVPTALGTMHHHDVGTPSPDTLEGLLYAMPGDRFLVDTHSLSAALGDTLPNTRTSSWFGYAPIDPAQLAEFNGLLFVKDASRPTDESSFRSAR